MYLRAIYVVFQRNSPREKNAENALFYATFTFCANIEQFRIELSYKALGTIDTKHF